MNYRGVVGGRWRCPGAGGAFCVEKTGFVRSAAWMTFIESIAATPDVAPKLDTSRASATPVRAA